MLRPEPRDVRLQPAQRPHGDVPAKRPVLQRHPLFVRAEQPDLRPAARLPDEATAHALGSP